MFHSLKIILLVFILGFSLCFSLVAQEDAAGSKDHPMISRYEGSFIYLYEHSSYTRLEIPWKMEDRNVKEKAVEGEYTHIFYGAPEGLSALQVHKNYLMALKDAGFDILYECALGHDKCGRLFRDFRRIDDDSEIFIGKDHCYFAAQLENPSGNVIVTARTVLHTHHEKLDQRPVTELQIIEEKSMETGKVEVNLNADAMAEDIENTGKVRIYGIHFDVDKSTIKSESAPTLSEIASLLKNQEDLNLLVVGHTDVTGGFDHNMKLSRKRAEAVADYLATEHNISPERLRAYGVGFLAPVAPNNTEDGRARNRRVELVKLY